MSSQSRELNARAVPEAGQVEMPPAPVDVDPNPPRADALDLPDDPVGPAATETKAAVASQWQLMRWKFRKHKLAVISLWVLALLYFVGAFSEFLAPADPEAVAEPYKYLSPKGIAFHGLRPGVYGLTSTKNPDTLRVTYTPDPTKWYPLEFFARGDEYKMWNL